MIKKTISLVLAIILSASILACGGKNASENKAGNSAGEEGGAGQTASAAADPSGSENAPGTESSGKEGDPESGADDRSGESGADSAVEGSSESGSGESDAGEGATERRIHVPDIQEIRQAEGSGDGASHTAARQFPGAAMEELEPDQRHKGSPQCASREADQ